MEKNDTIAAITTPPGRGGVGIVRVSGPDTVTIAEKILGSVPKARYADFREFKNDKGELLDQGIALYFSGPKSFTGEDVLELQGHGGPIILDLLLQQVIQSGARLAKPGEFSERAFLNGKMDLTQAEAIADIIESNSTRAVKMALRSLQGDFSDNINQLLKTLIELRMYVESAIDFPEEEIDFLSDGKVMAKVEEVLQSITEVLRSAQQGSVIREGMTVVLTGQPNAGKSTLLNALAGREAAIVTDVAGTTRDVLREQINIDGMPLHIIDTAGLRDSNDAIEREGIRRAWEELKAADRILLLTDHSKGITEQDKALLEKLPDGIAVTIIRNKVDVSNEESSITENDGTTEIALSAKQGLGVELLISHLKRVMGVENMIEGGFIARRRHIDALQRAEDAVKRGKDQLLLASAGEILAEELRIAQQALSEITGRFSSDDLLGEIFSNFCIGK